MNVKSTALTHLETLKDNLKNKNVSKTANIFDLDANPQVLDEVIALVKNDEIDEVIFHGDAFDRGSQNIRVFDRFKLLKALLGSKFIYILGNHELLMLDSIFLRDEISFENWIRNGGHTVIEEVNHTNTLTVWDLAEWVFLNAQLFYIDDKDWLHVHAGIPKDLTLKTMSIEQAAFEKIQQELKDTDNLNTSEYERIFEKMTALFWIRRWSVRFIEISQRSYVSNNLKDSQKIFHETQTL
ncbi:MAG: metallophosphoesterase, partial [Thiomargarita sp.]|nr:metallophosphoesterase [Thiomargarita sp.]